MSTSDIKGYEPSTSDVTASENENAKTDMSKAYHRAINYFYASMGCLAFACVYELFGHGVMSYHMLLAFLGPLVLGVLPWTAIYQLRKRGKQPVMGRGAFAKMLWATGVAFATMGAIVQGALDIYGTTNHLIYGYLIVAPVCLIAGVIGHILER